MVKPKYPTWKVQGSPTPAETLYICDDCGKAQWSHPGYGGYSSIALICYNTNKHSNSKNRRMRLATPAETEEGKKCLRTIIK